MVSISQSNFELKFSSFLSTNFLRGSQSCILHLHGSKLMKINYFENCKIFYHFMILNWKKLATCWNFFGGFVKTALFVSMQPFFKVLKNLCFSYRLRTFDDKKFGFMSEKFRRGCQNCFPCFTENFRRKVLSRKKLWVFLTVSETQQILWLFAKKTW